MTARMRFQISILMLALVPAFIAGCGGGGEDAAAPAESAEPAAGGTPPPATDAPAGEQQASAAEAAVTGKVIYDGTPPERPVLETEGDPKCFAMHQGDPLLSDREVVGPDGGVQWAFVYVKNPPASEYPVPETDVVLDQVGCRYTPHVLGVRVGQKMTIKNSDDLLHNVRGIARDNKPMNYGQPAGSPPRTKVFDEPEMAIRMKCDVHPWMTAFTFAMDHPYFDVTDENGQFAISGLPAGEYTLGMWHEAYGEQEATITVGDDGAAEASFTVQPVAE